MKTATNTERSSRSTFESSRYNENCRGELTTVAATEWRAWRRCLYYGEYFIDRIIVSIDTIDEYTRHLENPKTY